MTAPAEDPRTCGWMADQPDGQTCGERAVVAVLIEVFDASHVPSKSVSGLMLCERHNWPARDAT